jgi:hypothetical protein
VAEAWADLGMTTPHAQDAIDKGIVPMEIYPSVLERATEPLLKTMGGLDTDYEPMPNLEGYLRGIGPRMNTAEFDMVVYWQWVHATPPRWQKLPAKAWKDLRMTQQHAREAIEKRIVPMEIYPEAFDRAYSIQI